MEIQYIGRNDPCVGSYTLVATTDSFFECKKCQTPGGISAHGSPAAIGIQKDHLEITLRKGIGKSNEDHPFAPNASPTRTDLLYACRIVFRKIHRTIVDDHEIIPRTVHLSEFHLYIPL